MKKLINRIKTNLVNAYFHLYKDERRFTYRMLVQRIVALIYLEFLTCIIAIGLLVALIINLV